VALVVHEQVLGLEVAVHDHARVHVAEDLDDLHERPVDLRGREALLGEH